MKRVNERWSVLNEDGTETPLEEHGRYKNWDNSPNLLPNEVPPFDRLHESQAGYAAWIFRSLTNGKTFQWEIVTTKKASAADALAAIKAQCKTWGIRFVKRQWVIVKTTETVTREVVEW